MPEMTVGGRIRHRYVESIRSLARREESQGSASRGEDANDRRAIIVMLTAALSLTMLSFGATTRPHWFVSTLSAIGLGGLAERFDDAFFASANSEFNTLAFWGVMQVLSYVLLPSLVITRVLRERLSDFGGQIRGIGAHGRTYIGLFVVSVPFIVFASTTAAFQKKYPFYDLAPGEGLWPFMFIWWIIYAAQFMALEFFFRGFLVHGLKARLGYMAVFVMIIPYTMLHFTKPPLEALAAIAGGFVLGSLSLETRSVWWGAGLHIGVAGTMDVLSLAQQGLLF
jgi:hypothetical protein